MLTRLILSAHVDVVVCPGRCFVLVDSVRGLCAEDKELLRFLMKVMFTSDIVFALLALLCAVGLTVIFFA